MSDPEDVIETPPPESVPNENPDKTFDEVVQEVYEGKWGQGQEQRQRLSAAGFNHNEVRKAVNRLRNK